ncbi:LysR family transcriptional regulator [Hydrogenophaga sp.]|uniref:LysR family transcriptional regulator n=1 Tax=Hydrogenophaga sp. TaxID=1904254 RepID=UPI002731FA41|nr:LysR family transcriptional regulator [Hydrogenophaga sp.]MDP2015360.1 LysR family transcriptional regulator [Hydrogenophaga sp.]MDP3168570.1 LysR family transcriptional regulator [Hydrogenophaga sp.]MDP3812984.1 LysR family transcriptional regulator [Hydrogenophaga sp.]
MTPSPLAASISSDMLTAFLKVADRLSVSGAADELGLDKSVVSKRVAQLENKVQATLFSRSTRKVALTPAGEAYVDYARRALAEMLAGEERLRALRLEVSGRIRLTAPVSWGQRVLAKRLPEFLRMHPAIELELQLVDRMLDIASERIDIALRWTAHSTQELSAVPIAPVGWLLAASPAYLAATGVPSAPGDLRDHNCLCYWRDSADDMWTLLPAPEAAQDRVAQQVRVGGRYHVDNPEAVAEAAMAGLGIALLPDYLCQDELTEGRLLRVLPLWTPQTKFGSHITAVGAPERMSLARNRLLVGFLRDSRWRV